LPSVGRYVDPASGGASIFLAQALDKLGIAAELKSKICLVSPPAGQTSPRVGEVVQRGEVQIGIQPISELMEVPGIDSSLEGSGFEPSVPRKAPVVVLVWFSFAPTFP